LCLVKLLQAGRQSNGMAESFVNTFKRDYVASMDLSDAATVRRICRWPSSASTRCIYTRR
jgi:hypothetical protein